MSGDIQAEFDRLCTEGLGDFQLVRREAGELASRLRLLGAQPLEVIEVFVGFCMRPDRSQALCDIELLSRDCDQLEEAFRGLREVERN